MNMIHKILHHFEPVAVLTLIHFESLLSLTGFNFVFENWENITLIFTQIMQLVGTVWGVYKAYQESKGLFNKKSKNKKNEQS